MGMLKMSRGTADPRSPAHSICGRHRSDRPRASKT